MTNLRLFDLNLLIAFDALMAERNVTRAAQRVGIGQPAMSYSLARLRELFGDDLFIRTSGVMQPTNRAFELSEPIARILADIREDVLADRVFRPEVAEPVFRVGATDYAEVAVLPAVLATLRSLAPNARVAISLVDRERVAAMLESGAIDLAIAYFPDPNGVQKRELLFNEEFVCVFDAKACGVAAPIKLRSYLELPHLLMSLRGDMSGCVDRALASIQAERFVFATTSHFLTIPFLLRGLRAVATIPRRLAENCADVAGLSVSPLPIAAERFDVSMLWHARTETDPAHRWFRQLVREAGVARRRYRMRPIGPCQDRS
jgi:LysR family transcriptional regulator, mexEF-oprN operon transcriptional activator